MSPLEIAVTVWFGAVSLFSVAVTVYDKAVSKKPKRRRIPEKMLFLSAVLGGSVAMYLTMLLVRHKTKHKRFMIGIPAIIIVQYGLLLYFVNFAG